VVRKTVTILFADVTGSTQLGERLDPEALRRVMTRYFEVSRAALERHGATVEKFVGDAVMAVFGVPAVHEDDALRAARAALDLRSAVSALGLELRIGVNTGEVVAEAGETLVTGDAVNVAARLEQAAAPGDILLGATTYLLTRDGIRADALAPIEAKGKSEPVAVWRLLDVLDDAPAFSRRLDLPFVGRDEELAQLVGLFERAAREGTAQRVTLLGVPGIGKSRLARELVQRVGDEARVVVGRCLAYGDGITYWPLAEIVHATAGAGVGPDAIAMVAGDRLVADRVAAAIGAGGAAGTKEETQWAARRYLEALAAERPAVVVLDDLHWAEPTFLDLVEYVADFAAAPLLLLCTARSELLDVRPAWTAPRPNAATIALEPLPENEAAELAGELDDETRRRVLDAAEGNPLFLEQLGALRTDGDAGRTVPPTLQALLAARIDSLSPAERAVIECASVEGRLFHRGSVAELAPEDVRPDVAAHLLALVRKEFVRPDRAQLPGDDGYRFAHVLVRDAAYDSMAKELRAGLHERFADWLGRAAVERLGELEEIIGYHLEQANLYRRELDLPDPGEAGRRAGELLARAGVRAYDRGDLPAAENLLSRAASLLPPGNLLRARALPLLGAAIYAAAGGVERALPVLERALEESDATGDPAAGAVAWAIDARVRIQGVPETNLDAIEREAEARAPEIERLGDARALVCLRHLQHIIALYRVEDVDGASERLLVAARDAGDRPSAYVGLFFLSAWGVFGTPTVEEALAATRGRFRRLAEGPAEEAAVDHIEGLLRGMRGELDAGRLTIRRTRAAFAELGMRMQAVATGRDEARIERYAGDAAAVERVLRPTCDELRSAGNVGALSGEIAELGDALYELGRYDEAEAAAREGERLAQDADVSAQVLWRRVRAKVLARRAESDVALRLAREAIELAGWRLEEAGDAYRDLAEVERVLGRPDRAAAALERAIAAYEQKGVVPMAERARGELAAVRAKV
jgi:class 3 adenylate cyclase/tetratricopeptide (TPR) repeat protein